MKKRLKIVVIQMSYELNVENVTADPYTMTKERQGDTQLYAKTIKPNIITQTFTQKGWETNKSQ